jgi:hypothetical protein
MELKDRSNPDPQYESGSWANVRHVLRRADEDLVPAETADIEERWIGDPEPGVRLAEGVGFEPGEIS